MKELCMLFILSVFLSLVNIASAEIKITDADAVLEKSLQRTSIPTQVIPIKGLFINSEDAILTKSLSSISVPTQAVPLTSLFINSEDAIATKSLSSVNIPTKAMPLTGLFIVSADAVSTKYLVPLGGTMPAEPSAISSFRLSLDAGLNIVSLPLKPPVSLTARSFAQKLDSTMVIRYDTKQDEFLAFVPEVFAGDGFPIEGGRGYIVNQLTPREVVFAGTAWSNAPAKPVSSALTQGTHWAFVICGSVYNQKSMAQNSDVVVTVENLRTGNITAERIGQLETGRYSVAFVDRSRSDVVNLGDSLCIRMKNTETGATSKPIIHMITSIDMMRSYVRLPLQMEYFVPERCALLQNYPNPFNPDTWIPYQLREDAKVVISIYTTTGQLLRMLDLGHKRAGFYTDKGRAAYWDGRDESGDEVSTGVYFYSLKAGNFRAIRKLAVVR